MSLLKSCEYTFSTIPREREREMEGVEKQEIVIVGGGICGLATALALHRKGMRSVVLERAESLRGEGAAIGIFANGWRALDQLGLPLSSRLRETALPMQRAYMLWLDKGTQQEVLTGVGEARCLRRSDLINALADALPCGTIRFGCSVSSVELDPNTSIPVIHLLGGKSITAKILIGCDGARSVVGKFLELKPTKIFALSAVRGLTYYANGHGLSQHFVRMKSNGMLLGRIPIDDKSVYWFQAQQSSPQDATVSKDPELIRQRTLESIANNGFPEDITEMIKISDAATLTLTQLRYRAPWDLLFAKFRKGTVTVAGDAMHVMGPFLGQGGSAGLEDAVVLARRLSELQLLSDDRSPEMPAMMKKVGEAMDRYIEDRRRRLVSLSTQTYLNGLLLLDPSLLLKFVIILFMVVFFRNQTSHTKYDCGRL